jgi:RNA recognition motif-containing protein
MYTIIVVAYLGFDIFAIQQSGRYEGYGFVTFEYPESANELIQYPPIQNGKVLLSFRSAVHETSNDHGYPGNS